MNRTTRALLATLVAAATLAGCSAAPSGRDIPTPTPSPTPTASVSPTPSRTAVPGLSLRDAGFTHGPEGFTIPGDVSITRRVDQPNVVTALFSNADGSIMLDHLTTNLAAMGFTITASGGDSLVFSNDEWDGAFTISPELSGVTLRRKAG